jgi:hypothetical protein
MAQPSPFVANERRQLEGARRNPWRASRLRVVEGREDELGPPASPPFLPKLGQLQSMVFSNAADSALEVPPRVPLTRCPAEQ